MDRYKPAKPNGKGGDYFPTRSLEFIKSGCTLLDCILGGGWILGRPVNIVGDKSVGKCARDYYMLTSKGLVYSEDLLPKFMLGATPINWTLGLDRETHVKATHFWKEKVDFTYNIETRHGIELTATPDHKVQVLMEDGSLVMKSMEAIGIDDWVVVSHGNDLFPEQEVTIALELRSRPTKYLPIEVPITLTPLLGMWLGAVIADGCLTGSNIGIEAHKPWKRALLQDWSDKLFPGAFRTSPVSFVYSSQVKELVANLYGEKLDGKTARYKKVPAAIMRSPKEVQAAFLKSLLDFDGEVVSKGLYWSTASKRLARDVQMMLLNFGIFGVLHSGYNEKYKWTYYGIGVSGPRFDLYAKVIGTHRKSPKKPYAKTVSDISSIPFGRKIIQQELLSLRKRLGWSRNGKIKDGRRIPGLQAFCIKGGSASYRYFEECVEKLEPFTSMEFKQKAAVLLSKQFVFDKVIKKVSIKGPQVVSDVHVPGGHLFWGSGLINHNTLLAIEAAANFSRQYPTGNIEYREAEAAFDIGYAKTVGLPAKKVNFGPQGIDTLWDTIDQIYDDLEARIRVAKKVPNPGLYIIDSLDALTSKEEKGRDRTKGTYGQAKPKIIGELFRTQVRDMRNVRKTLMIISQIRAKIGGLTFGESYTISGGHSLDFYCNQRVFLKHIGTIVKTINGLKRTTGVRIRAKVTKNKVAESFGECEFVIRYGYGIDDLMANVDWLEAVGRLEEIDVKDPGKFLARSDKLAEDEYKKLVAETSVVVEKTWKQVGADFKPRHTKYA